MGLLAAACLASAGCARPAADSHGHEHDSQSWAVTSWGDHYEVFAEADPLTAGEVSRSHTHVTLLDGFQPLTEGRVSVLLTDSTGATQVFTQEGALRAGIFQVELRPAQPGTFELAFRIEGPTGREDIPSGRVRVGSHGDPGALVQAATSAGATAPGSEQTAFLKEQQWRGPFATGLALLGSLPLSVGGPARVRAAAGGEAVLTAPLDGVVAAGAALHTGMAVTRGAKVLELLARGPAGRTHAELESEWTLAKERLARLEVLHAEEAVSRVELDRARARAATLRAELDAVAGGGRAVPVIAPLTGRVAEVLVVPGAAVAAGAPLARIVLPDPVWVEVGLRPEAASRLGDLPAGLVLQGAPGEPPRTWPGSAVRLVSRAPEVDRHTGLVQVLVEVQGEGRLQIGSVVQAELLLHAERDGIVVPAESVVDDAGVPVVYVQASGESFQRREVTVLARQGDRVLIRGVAPAERVVTLGATAIRRAAQMSSGAVEGHVH